LHNLLGLKSNKGSWFLSNLGIKKENQICKILFQAKVGNKSNSILMSLASDRGKNVSKTIAIPTKPSQLLCSFEKSNLLNPLANDII